MKGLVLAAAAALALTTSTVFAADLYAPAPVPPVAPAAVPPPLPTWTGFYLGLNYGLSGDRFDFPIQVGTVFGVPSLVFDRGIGGVQIGYNWQIGSHWIVGLEADLDGSDIEKVRDYTNFAIIGGTLTAGANLDWFGTVRPRLGFAVTPTAMLYVTGGWVYGHTSTAVTLPAGTSLYSDYKSGWAAGGGLEYALTDWLSFKTEYIWLDLGTASFATPAFSMSESFMAHTLKAGLNVKLGSWGLH
jgi:outer membrane immunogenic protein